jgi:preprotein translocase subunit SecA
MDVFASKYGDPGNPTYGVVKVPTMLDSKTKLNNYINNIDDPDIKSKFKAFIAKYKKEAFAAFADMNLSVKAEALEKIFKIQIVQEPGVDADGSGGPVGPELHEEDAEEVLQSLAPKKVSDSKVNYQHQEMTTWGGAGPSSPRPQSQKAAEPVVRDEQKVGRNDPCPCGSGKKYKKCHGAGVE